MRLWWENNMAFPRWIISDVIGRWSHGLVPLLLFLSLASSSLSLSIKCGKCEESRCPELHYCEGEAVKDHCGCCTVCSSSRYQPHPLIAASTEREGGACQRVDCPKFKVCMENVQGLPLCTCPSAYICRSRKRSKPVCGTNGITYESRCHMRIAACNSATRIKVARKGACGEEEGGDTEQAGGGMMARARQCESYSRCKRRKNQRAVCGTDGKTYMSRCHLKITACQKGAKVRVRHQGTCEQPIGGPAVTPGPDPLSGLPAPAKGGGVASFDNEAAASSPSVSSAELAESRRADRQSRRRNGDDDDDNNDGVQERRKRRRDNRKKGKDRRRKRRKTRSRGKRRSRSFQRTFNRNAKWEY